MRSPSSSDPAGRSPPPDLAALLADPARVAELHEGTAVRALIDETDGRRDQLEAVHRALVRRALHLAVQSAPARENGRHEDDLLDDVQEVARIVRHSVSWVRRRGHSLPGFRQPGGKGCKVSWSRRALEAWVNSGAA